MCIFGNMCIILVLLQMRATETRKREAETARSQAGMIPDVTTRQNSYTGI